MLVVVIPIADSMDNDDLEAKLIKAVDALEEIPAGTLDFYSYSTGEGNVPQPSAAGRADDLSQVKEDFRRAIHEFFEIKDCRQITSFSYKGETFYITGGMSWGDSPTDAYDTLVHFGMLPFEVLSVTGAEMFQAGR